MPEAYRPTVLSCRARALEKVPGLFPDASAEILGAARHNKGLDGSSEQSQEHQDTACDQAIRVLAAFRLLTRL